MPCVIYYHPCQAAADYLALKEKFGDLQGVKLAYLGDGNNVAHSLMIAGAILGAEVSVVTPAGHAPYDSVTNDVLALANKFSGKVSVINGIENLKGADVLYTDTWISMGDNTPLEEIKHTFEPYQLNSQLMAKLGAQYAMHCQPAHRDLGNHQRGGRR